MGSWFQYRLARDIRVIHKAWSFRFAVLTAALCGLWMAMPAFQGLLPPVQFAGVCMGLSVAICFARMTGQRGFPDDNR